ncbi:hypothetical protein FACS189487_09760 [Campylobacterota bacterium]|nr:hypothetical protein FACS189487_09760 [Campylobacterota bacterium]
MKVDLTQTGDLKFMAKTARGVEFEVDPKNHISALEYFAIGAITCTATDIVLLPAKRGKSVKNLKVEGDFTRPEGLPYHFGEVHVAYSFESDGGDVEAERWVLSSLESYCTTLNTLRGTAKICYSITHNSALIADRKYIVSGGGGTNSTNETNNENNMNGTNNEPFASDACPS